MHRKVLSVMGIFLLMFMFYSCSSSASKGLLERYFHALSLNDLTTMSTIAVEPVALDVESWEILSESEGITETAKLYEMNQEEMRLKKELEDHVAPTVAADDALYDAKEKLKSARTRAARRAAQQDVDAAQAKYDEEREVHRVLQKSYNEAKAETAREEEICSFSLGAGVIPNIRDLTGEVSSQEVTIRTQGKSGPKDYKIELRKYDLMDEAANLPRRGRWIILKFESLD
jgi:hypothetical protein